MTPTRNVIFVSYSHVDRRFLARLRIHLKPFERLGLVEVWSDAKIRAGQYWKSEIEKALDRAAAAILLISADFLASEFIANNELPKLLQKAESKGVRILPVILKPCAFTDVPELSRFQSVNDPERPLSALDASSREALWHKVALTARDAVGNEGGSGTNEKIATLNLTIRGSQAENDWALLGDEYLAFFNQELQDLPAVDELIVYQYHFIDTLAYMHDAETVLSKDKRGPALIERVKQKLRSEGWEGDGRLQILWFPPFVGVGVEDTWGACIWHVKQNNNGTSWLASPVPLEFERLAEHNWWMKEKQDR